MCLVPCWLSLLEDAIDVQVFDRSMEVQFARELTKQLMALGAVGASEPALNLLE